MFMVKVDEIEILGSKLTQFDKFRVKINSLLLLYSVTK